MTKYQGKTATVIRDARQGDAGFTSNQSPPNDQVLIKLDNGTEKVVLRSDVITT